jgi:opacity protein-like surface antigen
MKKFATLTAMAFLLATAGAFAQAPPTTAPAGDQAAAKTTKTAKAGHKGHKKAGKTTTTPAPTPAAK